MHIHVAVDDPDKAIQIVNGLLAAPRAAARALGELAVLARRADRPRLEPPDRLLRLPALGPAAALPRLRGLRLGRRPARAHGLHRRLHAHLVGHPPAPEVGDDRGADLRRRHAARGRGRDRRLLPGARQAAQRALRRGRGDPLVPPDPDEREQVARRPLRARGAGDGPRHGPPDPRSRSRSSSGARCASSSRTRASSGRSASSRASPRCSAAATRPSASSASTTRTATSSRSCARSRTRPRRCPRTRPRPRAETWLRLHRERARVDAGEHRAAAPRERQYPIRSHRQRDAVEHALGLAGPRQVDAARHARPRVQRVDERV